MQYISDAPRIQSLRRSNSSCPLASYIKLSDNQYERLQCEILISSAVLEHWHVNESILRLFTFHTKALLRHFFNETKLRAVHTEVTCMVLVP